MIDLSNGSFCVNGRDIRFVSTVVEVENFLDAFELPGNFYDGVRFFNVKDFIKNNVLMDAVVKVDPAGISLISLRREGETSLTKQGWNVSIGDLRSEFFTLIGLVSDNLNRPADHEMSDKFEWFQQWGNVSVSININSGEVAIFYTVNDLVA